MPRRRGRSPLQPSAGREPHPVARGSPQTPAFREEGRPHQPPLTGTAEAVHGKVPTGPSWGQLIGPPAQPACWSPGPASYDSPSDPVLRANPCPEVTDPICRLPLPTLFYRLEAVHLGDLLRISVRPGTRVKDHLPRIFKGRRECTGHRGKHGVLRHLKPYLGASPFQGPRNLMKKRELFPGLPPASPGSLALPLLDPPWGAWPPCPGSGILT